MTVDPRTWRERWNRLARRLPRWLGLSAALALFAGGVLYLISEPTRINPYLAGIRTLRPTWNSLNRWGLLQYDMWYREIPDGPVSALDVWNHSGWQLRIAVPLVALLCGVYWSRRWVRPWNHVGALALAVGFFVALVPYVVLASHRLADSHMGLDATHWWLTVAVVLLLLRQRARGARQRLLARMAAVTVAVLVLAGTLWAGVYRVPQELTRRGLAEWLVAGEAGLDVPTMASTIQNSARTALTPVLLVAPYALATSLGIACWLPRGRFALGVALVASAAVLVGIVIQITHYVPNVPGFVASTMCIMVAPVLHGLAWHIHNRPVVNIPPFAEPVVVDDERTDLDSESQHDH